MLTFRAEYDMDDIPREVKNIMKSRIAERLAAIAAEELEREPPPAAANSAETAGRRDI